MSLAAATSDALVPLLKAYWILAAGSVIVTLLPVPLPQAFKDAVTLAACRGKLWHTKPDALGLIKDWSVPQSWFLHFYLVGAACNAASLLLFSCSCCGLVSGSWSLEQGRAMLALCLFQFHLVRRALETASVMQYPPDALMHGIAYIFGLSYYAVVPLSLLPGDWVRSIHALWPHSSLPSLPGSISACTGNLRAAIGKLQHQGAPTLALAVVGSSVFLGGNALQCASHWALAQLSGGKRRSEKTAYRIPRGPLFEWVSCPHYLAEIIIYCGLALVTGGSINSLLMLVWVAVNLVLAAGASQAWYHSRFKTYPAKRRALVPFVY